MIEVLFEKEGIQDVLVFSYCLSEGCKMINSRVLPTINDKLSHEIFDVGTEHRWKKNAPPLVTVIKFSTYNHNLL